MPEFTENLLTKILNTKPRDLIYPGILLLTVLIVGILFSSASKFISKNINNVFSGDIGVEQNSLNMNNYLLVVKKLGINAEVRENTLVAPTSASVTATSTTDTDKPEVLDKTSITIKVLNSTTKKGAAGILADALENDGFSKPDTGNASRLYATTIVQLSNNISEFEPLLLETVRKYYPSATATTTTETSASDATIIIGAN